TGVTFPASISWCMMVLFVPSRQNHHVVGTGVVLSVTEQQQGAPSGLAREFLRYWIVDRIVNGWAQVAVFPRPQFRYVAIAVTALLKAVHHLGCRLREATDQPQVIVETNHEY